MAGVLVSDTVSAGVRPQLTRIVAYASDKETPVEVINDSSETYMLQSWLEDLQGQDNNIPLVLTPPVMKIEGEKARQAAPGGDEKRNPSGPGVGVLAVSAGNPPEGEKRRG